MIVTSEAPVARLIGTAVLAMLCTVAGTSKFAKNPELGRLTPIEFSARSRNQQKNCPPPHQFAVIEPELFGAVPPTVHATLSRLNSYRYKLTVAPPLLAGIAYLIVALPASGPALARTFCGLLGAAQRPNTGLLGALSPEAFTE